MHLVINVGLGEVLGFSLQFDFALKIAEILLEKADALAQEEREQRQQTDENGKNNGGGKDVSRQPSRNGTRDFQVTPANQMASISSAQPVEGTTKQSIPTP